MTDEQSLEIHFKEKLDLPDDATKFLLDLWNIVQVFDDVADNDKIERADLDRAIWDSMAGIPLNEFYNRHRSMLVPVIMQATLKWMASDLAEREGKINEQTYMWRAGYYDVVCCVAVIVHGVNAKVAINALELYGETYEEYKGDF